MIFKHNFTRRWLIPGLASLLGMLGVPSVHANVYATNIKFNDSSTNATAPSGSDVSISYILNEPATRGVTVRVLSGATVVRTLNIPPESTNGAARGLNTIIWDTKTDTGQNAAL